MEGIQTIIEMKESADYQKCVKMAREMFETYFNNNIQDLVHSNPKDSVDKHGQPFWMGSKRFPTAATFNKDDELHVQFVASAANLIAFNLGI